MVGGAAVAHPTASATSPAAWVRVCVSVAVDGLDVADDVPAALYRRGGFGYGEIKKSLADAAEKFWAEPRARRAELAAKPEYVRQVLGDGATKARKKAAEVLSRAQEACGIG